MAIAAISASDPASAANLRARAPLLQRCRNGASVENVAHQAGTSCTEERWWQSSRLGKQCCAKSLGSWLPIMVTMQISFANLGDVPRCGKGNWSCQPVSDRMVNAMKGLKKSQSRLKRSTTTIPCPRRSRKWKEERYQQRQEGASAAWRSSHC